MRCILGSSTLASRAAPRCGHGRPHGSSHATAFLLLAAVVAPASGPAAQEVWLLARHPGRWAKLLRAFPPDAGMLPEAAAAVLERELGSSVEAIEAEWRLWAGGDSPIARASGHGG